MDVSERERSEDGFFHGERLRSEEREAGEKARVCRVGCRRRGCLRRELASCTMMMHGCLFGSRSERLPRDCYLIAD